MAVESATYIDDLNDSYPPGSDPRSQGDDHLRLIKSVLKATFPNVDDVFVDLSHTWSATQTFTGIVTLESTSATADAGPDLDLYRNSASPADGDLLSRVLFQGKNESNTKTAYAAIRSTILDATGSTEDGKLEFGTVEAGAFSYDLYLTGAALGPASDEGLNLGTSSLRFGVAYLDTLQARDGGVLGDASGDAVTIKGTVLSAYMAGLFSTSSVANLRTALELGTAALANIGTSGATVPLLNAANLFGHTQSIWTNGTANRTALSAYGHMTNVGQGVIDVGQGVAIPNVRFVRFINLSASAEIGSIQLTTSSSVTYATTSDGRFKPEKDRRPILNAGELIDALEPIYFKWKDGTEDMGFIAQDAARVHPLFAISGEGEPTDENFTPWMMEKGRLEAILTAEVQALRRRVAALEAG